MCATEDFIRASAARGLSKTATREALGFGNYRFDALVAAMPDVKWCAPHESIDARRAKEDRRGQFTEAQRSALKAAAKVLRERHVYTVRGVSGTIPELVARFKVAASACTVRRRMRHGLSLEAALFALPTPPALRKVRPLSTWEAVDAEFAGKPAPQCM